MMTIPMHTDNRIKNGRMTRGIRMLNVFIRRTNKLELITLLILPSPIWPLYFIYGETIKGKLRKIITDARKHKQQ
jgi:hypothetical protein